MSLNFHYLGTLLAALFAAVIAFPASAQEEAPKQTLITNISVWVGSGEQVIAADVLIENNLIKQVQPNIMTPEGATVIDGRGGTLTPGLIDMHTHIMLNGPKAFYTGQGDYDAFAIGAWAYRDMNMLLDQGFTSIREIAGNSLSLAKATKSGDMSIHIQVENVAAARFAAEKAEVSALRSIKQFVSDGFHSVCRNLVNAAEASRGVSEVRIVSGSSGDPA